MSKKKKKKKFKLKTHKATAKRFRKTGSRKSGRAICTGGVIPRDISGKTYPQGSLDSSG